MSKHVVFFSGGVGSWAAAKKVSEQVGPEQTILLFADTLIEDEDLYRFVDEVAVQLGVEIVKLVDGRTPWQVFRDNRWIGNTRTAHCSQELKTEQCEKWVRANCDPALTTLYMGIDWTEEHRLVRARARWKGWSLEAPLCSPPYMTKSDLLAALVESGIQPPRLYSLGFPHNNCGGFCVRAGQSQFALLLKTFPERYAEHELEELALRDHLGKDVSILRDRRGGDTKALTLRALRERIQAKEEIDPYDWGGCGCFLEDEVVAVDE